MAPELTDEVALVTGGASGIGAACVRALAAAGARVVIADRSAEAAAALAGELGDRALATAADVVSEDGTEAMVRAAVEHFGRLDLAVNSAGVGVPDDSPVGEVGLAAWRQVTSVNLDGVFLSMRAEIPAMLQRGGSIVNIASVLGSVAVRGASPYVAAKHGVVGLTKSAALEYAEQGVRVNAIGPGFIDTPLLSEHNGDAYEQIATAHPIGRLGTPDEIAQAVLFVLCPGASFLTGAYVPVDGGYLSW